MAPLNVGPQSRISTQKTDTLQQTTNPGLGPASVSPNKGQGVERGPVATGFMALTERARKDTAILTGAVQRGASDVLQQGQKMALKRAPAVLVAKTWAQGKPTQVYELPNPVFGTHVPAHSSRLLLDSLVELDFALQKSDATPAERTRVLIQRSELLQQLRRFYETHDPDNPVLETIVDNIANNPVVATRVFEGKDNRVLQRRKDLQQAATQLVSSARSIPGMLPDTLSPVQLKSILAQTFEQVGNRSVYTRPGYRGVSDLVADDHLSGALRRQHADNKEELARIISAQTCLGQAADIVRMHPVRVADGPADTPRLPLEVTYVLKRDPALRDALKLLEKEGLDIQLQKLEGSPLGTLEAIQQISVLSQENYTLNWLPQLVRNGHLPRLDPTENGIKRAQGQHFVEPGEVDVAAIKTDLEEKADLISRSAGHYLRFVVPSSQFPSEAATKALDQLNKALEPVAREYAVRRMIFDNADERTHEAQAIIKRMMWVGPIAHSLEMANLGSWAKVFCSSADDVLGEIGELQALHGAGYAWRELAQRMKLAVPVLGLATGASATVEPLLEHGHTMLAGGVFGASAVALSLTTAIQSVMMYRKAVDSLLSEGKVEGKMGALMGNEEFQKQLSAYAREASALLEPAGKPKLLEMVRGALQQEVEGGRLDAAELDAIITELEKMDLKAAMVSVQSPGELEKWKMAVIQDFSNPARLGLLLGASMAPVAGMAGASLGLMHNGMVMAGLGSTESLVAGASVMAARKLSSIRYEAWLQQQIKDA